MTTEFSSQRLNCSRGPDLIFEGRLLGSYSTQNKAGTRDRWTELRLWETSAGNWIAENCGMSSRPGDGTIREARRLGDDVSEPGRANIHNIAKKVAREGAQDSRQFEAMEVWAWSTAAKAFARDLGWDMAVRVN